MDDDSNASLLFSLGVVLLLAGLVFEMLFRRCLARLSRPPPLRRAPLLSPSPLSASK